MLEAMKIYAERDETGEAPIWIATSAEVIGLVVGAETLDALWERLHLVVPNLMAANGQEGDWVLVVLG